MSSQRITIKDVARVSGCSVGTVSHVLNGRPGVKPSSHASVLAAIEQLGFKPDFSAKRLRTGRTFDVAMVARDFTNPHFSVVAQAAEKLLEKAGYSFLVVNTEARSSREGDLVRMLIDRRVDGLILSPGIDDGAELVQMAAAAKIPVVCLDREAPAPADRVITEHVTGVRTATKYLLDLGHRDIAMITGNPRIYTARARAAGYCAAMRDAGLPEDRLDVLAGSFDRDHGRAAAEALLQRRNPPSAIICGSASHLLGLLPVINEQQMSLPDDLSVVCCDDSDVAQLYRPAITVVSRNVASIGEHAASLLIERLQGTASDSPRTIRVATEVVLRQSCARLPA